MPLSRRDFLKLMGTALVAAGCAPVIKAIDTATSAPPPTDAPTQRPDPTATEMPNALKPGRGGEMSPEERAFFDSDMGKRQQEWLTAWVGYWSTAQESQRAFFPESPGSDTARVYYKIMSDPRSPNTHTIVLESPDYPGVVMMPPAAARENMSPPPESTPNHEIKVGNGPLQLSNSSGAELAKLGIPEGSSLVFHNDEFMLVDQSGNIVGVVNFKTGQWENADTIRNMFVVADINNSERCRINSVDDMERFRMFAKLVDNTTFGSDVVVGDIRVMMPPSSQPQFLDWLGGSTGTGEVVEFYKGHESARPYVQTVACRTENTNLFPGGPSGDVVIDAVKFIDGSGRISFILMMHASGLGGDFRDGHFPPIIVNTNGSGFHYPADGDEAAREVLLQQWARTGVIPRQLENFFLLLWLG